jgi:lipopolysaccharide biosynthesis glycosyltransferase
MFVSILENSPSAAAVHFYVIDDNINFESKQLLYFTIKHTQINAELTFLKNIQQPFDLASSKQLWNSNPVVSCFGNSLTGYNIFEKMGVDF